MCWMAFCLTIVFVRFVGQDGEVILTGGRCVHFPSELEGGCPSLGDVIFRLPGVNGWETRSMGVTYLNTLLVNRLHHLLLKNLTVERPRDTNLMGNFIEHFIQTEIFTVH